MNSLEETVKINYECARTSSKSLFENKEKKCQENICRPFSRKL